MRQINIQVPRIHPIRNQRFSLNNIYPKIPQACYRSLSIKKKQIKARSLSTNEFIKDIPIESHPQPNPMWMLLLSRKKVERKQANKTVEDESENKINISLDLKEMIRLKSRNSGRYKQIKGIQYDKKVKNKKQSMFSEVKSQQKKIELKPKQISTQTNSLKRSGCSLCQQILCPTKHHIKLRIPNKNRQNGHIQSRSVIQ